MEAIETEGCGRAVRAIGWEDATPSLRPRRVLVIAYDFPPSMEMGAQACAQISRHLQPYGWEPLVLTVHERYIQHLSPGSDHAFPGRIMRTRVMPHPLSIYRSLKTHLGPKADRDSEAERSPQHMTAWRRWMLSLLTIPDVYTGWICPATIAGWRMIRRLGVQCLFSSAPPWSNHLVGLMLAQTPPGGLKEVAWRLRGATLAGPR